MTPQEKKDYFNTERNIELTRHEMDIIITALENECENDLKAISEDCDNDIYSSEVYIITYTRQLNLLKKIKEFRGE